MLIEYWPRDRLLSGVWDGRDRVVTLRIGDTLLFLKYNYYNLEDYLGIGNLLFGTNSSLISIEQYSLFFKTSFGAYTKTLYRFCGRKNRKELMGG
jgi:hypothetical protein